MGFMFGPRDDFGRSLKLMAGLIAVAFLTMGIAMGLLMAWVL